MLNILKKWLTIIICLFLSTFVVLLLFGQQQDTKNYLKLSYNDLDLTMRQKSSEVKRWTEYELLRQIDESKKLSNVGKMLFLGENFNKTESNVTYTILMWKYGQFLERRHIKHFSTQMYDPFEKCSVKNCVIKYEDSELTNADLVIFHLHMTKGLQEIPPRSEKENQIWTFLSDESPYHTFLSNLNLKDFNGIFNWSMTYRSDSDIPVPYGRTVPLSENEQSKFDFNKWNENKKQDVLVAILSSNCNSKNNRWQYVEELKKFIKVDTYGKCGDLKCDTSFYFGLDCPIISKYKFYLAFENSNCDEYITEKVWWQSYHKENIPIVMGSSIETYKKILPPKSFMNVERFASPKALADYILFLNNSPSNMQEYFKWKKTYKVVNEHGYFQSDSFHYCRACEALNYNKKDEKIYDDLESFWSVTNDCH